MKAATCQTPGNAGTDSNESESVRPGMFCVLSEAVSMPGRWGPQRAKARNGSQTETRLNLSSAPSSGMWSP